MLIKHTDTQTPIIVEGSSVFADGCLPHSCGSDMGAIAIDTKDDAIFVAILKDTKLKLYYESRTVSVPAKFKEWIDNYTPTQPTYQTNEQKTQQIPKETSITYTSVGTIKSLEPQGNSFLDIKIQTADKSVVYVVCSDAATTVYDKNKELSWTGLKEGMKIRVKGTWGKQFGEKILKAKRVDVLL